MLIFYVESVQRSLCMWDLHASHFLFLHSESNFSWSAPQPMAGARAAGLTAGHCDSLRLRVCVPAAAQALPALLLLSERMSGDLHRDGSAVGWNCHWPATCDWRPLCLRFLICKGEATVLFLTAQWGGDHRGPGRTWESAESHENVSYWENRLSARTDGPEPLCVPSPLP